MVIEDVMAINQVRTYRVRVMETGQLLNTLWYRTICIVFDYSAKKVQKKVVPRRADLHPHMWKIG
jgi:hypothetical protein